MSVRKRTATRDSSLFQGSAAADHAIGPTLEVGIYVIKIGSDIGVVGEPAHHGRPSGPAKTHDLTKLLYGRQPVDQRGTEGRAKSIRAMAVVA